LPILGCIALGVAIGGVAGVLLLGTMVSLAKKLRARSNAFPKAEVTSLTSVLVFLTCAVWARSTWFPIQDPLCGASYFTAVMILMVAMCFPTGRALIRLCAQIVAGERRQ
jgi:hypothetical protein